VIIVKVRNVIFVDDILFSSSVVNIACPPLEETIKCNEHDCEDPNCIVEEWGAWTSCSYNVIVLERKDKVSPSIHFLSSFILVVFCNKWL
jgi:hypothetical protein